MAATCKCCQTTVQSFRDIINIGSAETRRIWIAVIEKLPFLGDVFCGGGFPAYCAEPLNRLDAPCPRCLSRHQWTACPEKEA